MAQAPNQPGDGGAQFVREIVTDPKNVPDVMLLYGYLGASSEEGHERLYLSPDLTNYVEVPKAAILYRAAAPKEQDPHGGVTLWVKKDAALKQKMAPAAQALAHYFAGAIQAGAAGAAAAPQPTPPATIVGCTFGQCPPVTIAGPLCTQGNTCGIDCSVVCPTRPPRATCAANCTVAPPCLTVAGQATCAPNCTQRTPCPPASCGIVCTVGGPVCGITRPADCQVATAFCTVNSCGVACTVGGPVCGITRPADCQVATARCTLDTCGIACTVAGPCQTRAADCQTQAATCACTDIGCPTDVTPCVNTHAVTCGACPSVIAACQSALCQTAGADCTFIGCGHTLACTQGLVCRGAAPAQPAAAAAALQCVGGTAAQFTPACPTWGLCPTRHATCFATCNAACWSFRTPCCPQVTILGCPQVTLACPQGTLACGPDGQAGLAPQAAALPTLYAWCTQVCHPGGGGGALPMAWGGVEPMAASWGGCSIVCTGVVCPPRPQPTQHNYTPCCPR